jgi:hypothetical protein
MLPERIVEAAALQRSEAAASERTIYVPRRRRWSVWPPHETRETSARADSKRCASRQRGDTFSARLPTRPHLCACGETVTRHFITAISSPLPRLNAGSLARAPRAAASSCLLLLQPPPLRVQIPWSIALDPLPLVPPLKPSSGAAARCLQKFHLS